MKVTGTIEWEDGTTTQLIDFQKSVGLLYDLVSDKQIAYLYDAESKRTWRRCLCKKASRYYYRRCKSIKEVTITMKL